MSELQILVKNNTGMKKNLKIPKGVIRIRISKNRQHNGQKKKYKRTNNYLQNIHIKLKSSNTNPTKNLGRTHVLSGWVSSSCSTSDNRRVNLITNLVISHVWGKNREVFTTSGTYPWSFGTQIFHNGQPSHGDDRKTFEVMIST
jgi:hypothetical protein